MAFLIRLSEFSLYLKIAWAVWLAAGYALIVWRRRGRTTFVVPPVMARPRKVKADVPAPSKRRWRLRANEDARVMPQSTSLLGLQ